MRIAFYNRLRKIEDKLRPNYYEINPGIGGTQFLFLLYYYYSKEYSIENQIYLITDLQNSEFIEYKYASNLNEALTIANQLNCDYLIIKETDVLEYISNNKNTKTKILLWAHNVITRKIHKKIQNTSIVRGIICVSEKQYQNMKHSALYPITYFVNNGLPANINKSPSDFRKNNEVVFIASIVPQKGLHNLLDIWRLVDSKTKLTKLHIIGSSSVWETNGKTGSMGITYDYYEKLIRKKLAKIKNSQVIFHGAKSWNEIQNIIKYTKIGVVNPSKFKRDETFCMTAVELQSQGIPVISRQRGDGLNTTVIHGETGFLHKNNRKIAREIVSLLNNDSILSKLSSNATIHASKFNINNSISKLIYTINEINNNNNNNRYNKSIFNKDYLLIFIDRIRYLIIRVYCNMLRKKGD